MLASSHGFMYCRLALCKEQLWQVWYDSCTLKMDIACTHIMLRAIVLRCAVYLKFDIPTFEGLVSGFNLDAGANEG